MIISDPVSFEFEGLPAVMRVLRNDGHCWGRIVTATGEQLDVSSRKDFYDWFDGDAAQQFINAVQRRGRKIVEPALREV